MGFYYQFVEIMREVAGRNCPVPYIMALENEMLPSLERIKKGALDLL